MSEDVPELLDRAELDLVISADIYASAAHPREPLFEESAVCVVSADNPLVGDTLSFDEYIRLGHVAVRRGGNRVSHHESWLLDNVSFPRRVEVTVNQFNALPQFVVGTNRVAIMHRRLAQWYSRVLPLRVLEAPIKIPPLTIVMQWHQSQDLDPGHVWLRSVLREEAQRIAGPKPAS